MGREESAVRITLPANELARVLGNALVFLPTRSMVKYALVDVYPDRVYTSGSDGYAAGTDWAACESTGVPTDGVPLLLDKESLTGLERAAREAKDALCYLKVADGTVTLYPGDQAPEVVAPWYQDEHCESLHASIREMVEKRDADPQPFKTPLCIDPSLMTRFGRVKADKTARQADLFVNSPGSPVLIKVGPTFRGLLMPIDRDVYATNVGQDGLW